MWPIALLGGVGSLLGGIFGGNAAKKAGNQIYNIGSQVATGISNNTESAVNNIEQQAATAGVGVNTAGQQAQQKVDAATAAGVGGVQSAASEANAGIQNYLGGVQNTLNPYIQTGAAGNAALQHQIANPFTLPTAADVEATPGFQFQLNEGLKGVNQQASAAGALQTGGTLKALTQYGQGLASTYYQNAVNNALSAYNTNTNTALAGIGTGLNANGQYLSAATPLTALQSNNTTGAAQFGAGLGLQGATQSGLFGTSAAQQQGALNLQGAEAGGSLGLQGSVDAGNFWMNAVNGQAAGTIGKQNAWNGAIGGIANAASSLPWGSILGSNGGVNWGGLTYGSGGGAPNLWGPGSLSSGLQYGGPVQ